MNLTGGIIGAAVGCVVAVGLAVVYSLYLPEPASGLLSFATGMLCGGMGTIIGFMLEK